MSLTRLSYFIAVAEELNFTRASARLHVSQPPLTQQIQRLEEEMGEKLIVRSTRRVSLTPAGVALLPEARRILEQYRRLPALAHESARNRQDSFVMGSIPSAIIGLVPSLLKAYRALEPGTSVQVKELNIEEQQHMLRTSDLDIGVFRSYRTDEEWETFELQHDDYYVVLGNDHPLAHADCVRWKDLETERFVMNDRSRAAIEFDSVIATCVANGFNPKIVDESVASYNLIALVAAGIGIGVVPGRVAALNQSGTVYRLLEPRARAVPLRMAFRRERFNEHARALVEIAKTVPANPDGNTLP
ncbi:LysR family transcriptional regulator [bacterium RCC_150]